MTPQGPNENQPWWLKAAQVAGASGASGNNPYGNFAQAAGQFGHALQDKVRQSHANRAADQSATSAIDSVVDGTPPTPYVPPPPSAMGDSSADDFGEPMADGKIVTKPTLAMIGEHQPEAVVPLGFRAKAKVLPSMATMATGRRYYGER